MQGWDNFFIAMAGAAATLAGLIFVGLSISLSKILELRQLTARAFESLMLLLTILIISSLALVPGQQMHWIGIEILFVGIVISCVTLTLDIKILGKSDPEYKRFAWLNFMLSQLSVLPYIIGGIMVLTQGITGLYWIVPAFIISIIKAVTDAWVLLVEINR